MTTDDDSTLLRRFSETRSEPDFRTFVERRFDFVYAAALRCVEGDVHLAREAAQNVFIDAARKASVLARRPSLLGWLCVSSRYAAAQVRRSQARRRGHEQKAAMNDTGAEEIAWHELRPTIDEVLAELGEPDREAILLRFFEGQSYAAVGAVLGLGENAARMRVERALEKLRGRLARRGITSTALALGSALASQPVVAAPPGMAAAIAGTSVAATAAAGLGTPVLLRLLPFMNTGKLTLATIGLCVTAGLGSYWGSQHRATASAATDTRQIESLRATVADLTRENGRLQAQLAASRDRPQRGGRSDDATRSVAGGMGGVAPTGAPATLAELKVLADMQQKRLVQPMVTFLNRQGKLDRSFTTLFALTPAEQERMQQVVDTARTRLAALEQANAKVTRDERGNVVISVQPFPGEGGIIYDETMSGIGEILGPERNDAFQKVAAPQVETMMGKFGAAERTYTFGYSENSSAPYSMQDRIVQSTPGHHDDYVTSRQYPTYTDLAASAGPIVNVLPTDYKRTK